MIRDPSDGSVKHPPMRPTSAENWGLKSLDKPERKPKPAPSIDELREHYAKHDLGFRPKEQVDG